MAGPGSDGPCFEPRHPPRPVGRYCQAYGPVDAAERGLASDKITAIWEFKTLLLFDYAEPVALRFARDTSVPPNRVGDGHFANKSVRWTAVSCGAL